MDNGSEKPLSSEEKKRRRGIYLLPNLFTTACLFSGFYAVVAAMGGRYEAAAIAVFIAMVMDGLDGRVARLTNTQTDFGAQYDSLADMVSFGVAPALVMYAWSLSQLGKPGWLAAFIYTAAAALRLARFNTQVGVADKRYFQGLASPAAAATVMGGVWVAVDFNFTGADLKIVAFILTVACGVLMVSNVRYRSFKDLDLKGKVPFVAMLVLVLVFVFISFDPPTVLFCIFFLYAMSGPVFMIPTLRQRLKAKRAARAAVSPQQTEVEQEDALPDANSGLGSTGDDEERKHLN
ncbi:MAG: CDP-diacylglycerol--serine O-phosphatidyltransferase [Gammaproteobacteria bacterium]|nr:CDP-diacylglycerol--serine O-phosphatidyltransferase [Gammaproteobacteria bacterium]MDH5800730.1 CDP-diacylglycerol--serine O-phosphatidyltransferase [Gammaproteobacteria bacterium]